MEQKPRGQAQPRSARKRGVERLAASEPAADDRQDAAAGGNATSESEQIRARAYELYLQRGGAPGDEREDWFAAEREYRERSSGGRGRAGAEDAARNR